jgi:ubiquinone/menaquinone biosynthesis C-methylase UbiE
LNSDEALRQTYDRIAPEFAARNALMPANLVALADRLARHAGQDGLILDIGCGPGRDTAWLERSGRRVVGLDLSFQMLKQAQRITHGRLAQVNMKALGLQDDCAGGIWCCAALLHLPKAEAPLALTEFRRLLRAGGMLIISVQEGSFEGQRYSEREAVTRYFSDYQPGEMRALLADHQFSVIAQSADPGGWHGTWLQTIALAR